MKNFIFLNYAGVKGYSFEVMTNNQPVNLKTFVNSDPSKEEKIVFANYKGRMVGALRFKTVVLPTNVFQQLDDNTLNGEKVKESILMDLLFFNDNPSDKDIIITGLLIKLQKYARKNGYNYCIAGSHENIFEMLRPNKFIRQEQIVECNNSTANVFPYFNKPFFLDFQKPLLNIGLGNSERREAVEAKVLEAA